MDQSSMENYHNNTKRMKTELQESVNYQTVGNDLQNISYVNFCKQNISKLTAVINETFKNQGWSLYFFDFDKKMIYLKVR